MKDKSIDSYRLKTSSNHKPVLIVIAGPNGSGKTSISKIISRYSRSIANCKIALRLADRTYIYDNSIDNEEVKILCRLSNGALVKKYVDDMPKWAEMILL